MKKMIQKLWATSKQSHSSINRPKPALRVEALEERRLMARTAFIDFGSETISEDHLRDGQWGAFVGNMIPEGDVAITSFNSMFRPGATDILDFNNDGTVNGTDASLARRAIVNEVRQDFAPYDLSIFEGNLRFSARNLTDSRVGDVGVMATGGTSSELGSFAPAQGLAPWTDLGNENDELVFVFGERIASRSISTELFVNSMARTISQEMAHAFGLGHLETGFITNPDAQPNHLMNIDNTFDRFEDPNFQDISYTTDLAVGGFRVSESETNPRWTVARNVNQNAHKILSDPDILGPSNSAWIAALKPGELTISGSPLGDTIDIEQTSPDSWSVDIVSHRRVARGFTRTFRKSAVVDTTDPSFDSIYPFDAAIHTVHVNGNNGNDTITMDAAITTRMIANGGEGRDIIQGGGGNDVLLGGNGNDILSGGAGNDTIQGGDGIDVLRGESGRDTLYGNTIFSDDGDVDTLEGGSDADRFGARDQQNPEDTIVDFSNADRDFVFAYFNLSRYRLRRFR